MTKAERIRELEAENAQQREQIATLLRQSAEMQQRLTDLEARLAKDSHNSSKPPASDGLKRPPPQTRSLRRRSGRTPGGQLGHRGETLHLVAPAQVDAVVEHRPPVCATCQASLDATAVVTGRERRQVHELPPTRLQVTEHQALQVRCAACQQVTTALFPSRVASRAQYGPHLRAWVVYLVTHQCVPYARVRDVLVEGYGVHLSLGTLVAWVRQAAQSLVPVETALKQALAHAPILHSDETGVRRAGRLVWAHVTSTPRLTHYAIHPKRGTAATDAIGILPGYTGVSVHDGWKPYQTYTGCRHALCNVHHLRELTFLEEQYQQTWATDLKALLSEMRAAVEQARTHGQTQLPTAQHDAFVARYEQTLAHGRAANPPHPPPEPRPHKRGRRKQSPARNLLERLSLGQRQVLAFLDDLTIPFDNNQAERDLRMLKVQQKISGGFRSDSGADTFARLRGYVSTLRKQGGALLTALESLFTDELLYPALA
ncbi:MAG: IS66 family transposase [Ktedonobacterales bacterium]